MFGEHGFRQGARERTVVGSEHDPLIWGRHNLLADFHDATELFSDLAHQRFRGALTGFDLAAREFPAASISASPPALRAEHEAVTNDHRPHHLDRFGHSFTLGVPICGLAAKLPVLSGECLHPRGAPRPERFP